MPQRTLDKLSENEQLQESMLIILEEIGETLDKDMKDSVVLMMLEAMLDEES